jgi:hypothetical protein
VALIANEVDAAVEIENGCFGSDTDDPSMSASALSPDEPEKGQQLTVRVREQQLRYGLDCSARLARRQTNAVVPPLAIEPLVFKMPAR